MSQVWIYARNLNVASRKQIEKIVDDKDKFDHDFVCLI